MRAAAGARARARRAERLPQRRRTRTFTDEEVELVERFATMAALAYDSARQRETLREQVQRDGLTGLLNHRACHERLRAGARTGGPVAVVLHRPRPLQGHQRRARPRRGRPRARPPRPSGCARSCAATDVVGRIGGEEFVLILPGADAEAAEDCAERARAALAELTVRGRPLAASAGVAAAPVDGDRGRRAARERRRRAVLGQAHGPRADRALRARRGSARRPSSATRSRRCWSAARARSRSSFQPVVELATGRAGGYEALDAHSRASRRAGRTSGSRRRTASGSGRSSRRWRCAPRWPSPAAPTAPSWRVNVSPRALLSAPVRAALPQDLTGIVDRAHRARGVRRRGRAGDRAGRAARARRAGRARRRRRGLRGPAADHPDRARHPQARPRARPRRARRRRRARRCWRR